MRSRALALFCITMLAALPWRARASDVSAGAGANRARASGPSEAASASRAPVAGGASLERFFERLRVSGRAEAHLVRESMEEAGVRPKVRGRVTLEPPDRARLDFDQTGERVTLRTDGGEWLQPRLRQLVKLGPERARAALEWWDLLLGRDRAAFAERALDDRRLLIVHAMSESPADSAWVTLDSRGLPLRIEVHPGGGVPETFRLADWKFGRPRGRADFVIQPPTGFELVDLP